MNETQKREAIVHQQVAVDDYESPEARALEAEYDEVIETEYWAGWAAYNKGLARVVPDESIVPEAWLLGYGEAMKEDFIDKAETQFEIDMIEIPELQYAEEMGYL